MRPLEYVFQICPLGLGLYLRTSQWALVELLKVYGSSRELCAMVHDEAVLTASSPILVCVRIGNIDILSQLFSLGMFSLSHRVKDFRMPLLNFVVPDVVRSAPVVAWLLAQGADASAVDDRGHNALTHALLLDNRRAALLILESLYMRAPAAATAPSTQMNVLNNRANGRTPM